MHGEKWHGQDVLWSRKVCWKCLFQGSGDPIVKVSPFTANHGGTLGDTDLANSKKLNLLVGYNIWVGVKK